MAHRVGTHIPPLLCSDRLEPLMSAGLGHEAGTWGKDTELGYRAGQGVGTWGRDTEQG